MSTTNQNALLDFLFKTNLNIDNVPTENIINLINKSEATIFSSRTNEDIALQEYAIENKLENIDKILSAIENKSLSISETTKQELTNLRLRILKTRDLVKQAMLGERTLVGETYTLQVPLKSEYTTPNTTATLKDDIVFSIGYEDKNNTREIKLDSLNISAKENTKFRIFSENNSFPATLNLEENLYKPYNEININVTSAINSGIFYIEFAKAVGVSILDKFGFEIKEPFVTDKIQFPINQDTDNFNLRFINNKNQEIKILKMYYTEATYNTKTIYESVPIAINKEFSFLTIETCDNFSTKNININYEVSINGSSYRSFRPNGKINNINIPSIIRVKDSNTTEIKVSSQNENLNLFRYYLPETINVNSHLNIYSLKLGEDVYSVESYFDSNMFQLYFFNKDLIEISLSDFMTIKIDGITYQDEQVIHIESGFHTLDVRRDFWKEIIDLNYYSINSVTKNFLTIVERSTGNMADIPNNFDTKLLVANSIYLQLLNKATIYLRKEEMNRKTDLNKIEYLSNTHGQPIYIYSEAYQTPVDTIQIKATLSTDDPSVCPYISKIIVRGI